MKTEISEALFLKGVSILDSSIHINRANPRGNIRNLIGSERSVKPKGLVKCTAAAKRERKALL